MEQEIVNESTPEIVETPITEQAVNMENAEPSVETVETKPEKTFTQAELDEIIQRRIERERESVGKKAAQEARDALIADENIQWNGKQIKTEAEYREMLKEQEIRKQYEGKVDDDLLDEIVEGKKFREQYNETQRQQAERTKQEADYKAFLDAYPDVEPQDVPQSVWDEVSKGKSLVDAYARHENQTLRQKLAEVEQAKQIEQQNQMNAANSTGSMTGKTGDTPTFFTQKQVNDMSTAEVNKHWAAINQSMKNPKFYD